MVDNFKIRIVVLKQLLKLDCFCDEIPRNFTDKNYYIAKKDWTLIRTSLKSAFFSEEFWGLFSSVVGRKSCKKCLKINEMSNVKRQGCTF